MNGQSYYSDDEEDITYVDTHSQLASVSSQSRKSSSSSSSGGTKETSTHRSHLSKRTVSSRESTNPTSGALPSNSKSTALVDGIRHDDGDENDEFDAVARSRQQRRRSLFNSRRFSDDVSDDDYAYLVSNIL